MLLEDIWNMLQQLNAGCRLVVPCENCAIFLPLSYIRKTNLEPWMHVTQGMYVLSNIASGREIHKDSVMDLLLRNTGNGNPLYILKFLQNNDSRLRTASVWVMVNLTIPSCLGASGRTVKLRNTGIISQLKNMVNDPCLDVKVRRFITWILFPHPCGEVRSLESLADDSPGVFICLQLRVRTVLGQCIASELFPCTH